MQVNPLLTAVYFCTLDKFSNLFPAAFNTEFPSSFYLMETLLKHFSEPHLSQFILSRIMLFCCQFPDMRVFTLLPDGYFGTVPSSFVSVKSVFWRNQLYE